MPLKLVPLPATFLSALVLVGCHVITTQEVTFCSEEPDSGTYLPCDCSTSPSRPGCLDASSADAGDSGTESADAGSDAGLDVDAGGRDAGFGIDAGGPGAGADAGPCGAYGQQCCGTLCEEGACLEGTCAVFGGAYQVRAGRACVQGNPLNADACSCPSGFVGAQISNEPYLNTTASPNPIFICMADADVPGADFRGAYRSQSGPPGCGGECIANPMAAGCSCPAGSTREIQTVNACMHAVAICHGSGTLTFGGSYLEIDYGATGDLLERLQRIAIEDDATWLVMQGSAKRCGIEMTATASRGRSCEESVSMRAADAGRVPSVCGVRRGFFARGARGSICAKHATSASGIPARGPSDRVDAR